MYQNQKWHHTLSIAQFHLRNQLQPKLSQKKYPVFHLGCTMDLERQNIRYVSPCHGIANENFWDTSSSHWWSPIVYEHK